MLVYGLMAVSPYHLFVYSGGGTYRAPGARAPQKLQHADCALQKYLH